MSHLAQKAVPQTMLCLMQKVAPQLVANIPAYAESGAPAVVNVPLCRKRTLSVANNPAMLKGSPAVNEVPVYGESGVPALANVPVYGSGAWQWLLFQLHAEKINPSSK